MMGTPLSMSKEKLLRWLPKRTAPLFAAEPMERVARLGDVEHLMRPGDPFGFSGRSVLGLTIRTAEYGPLSHVDIGGRDDEGHMQLIGALEGEGVTKRSLAADVKIYPGQYYWGIVHPKLDEQYDRQAAVAYAEKHLGQEYGYFSLAFQALIHLPFLREITFAIGRLLWNVPAAWALVEATGLDVWAKNLTAYCAGFLNVASAAGNLLWVARRPHYLIGPNDIYQSPAIVEWVALVP